MRRTPSYASSGILIGLPRVSANRCTTAIVVAKYVCVYVSHSTLNGDVDASRPMYRLRQIALA